ncbi:MAG: dienelactone hydrolase family protein [Pseudoxanthomonas suwonensis]|nr:dienelactone hydrolase family protein [Pseudoxanthomonas suwonensis]
MRDVLLALVLALCAPTAFAAMQTQPLHWSADGQRFSGYLVYDDAIDTPRPGLVMFPNWMGVSEAALVQAREIAGDDHVVLVADVYGSALRPENATEAAAAVKDVYGDGGTRLRLRADAAVEALKAEAGRVPLDATRIGVFGFCFGGSVALELVRSGAELAGAVSFHGGLERHLPAGKEPIRTPVLVLNGAADSSVTAAHISAFQQEMDAAGADWQFVNFGGAVHCFAQPESQSPPNCMYDPRAARRAFAMMAQFFEAQFDRERVPERPVPDRQKENGR